MKVSIGAAVSRTAIIVAMLASTGCSTVSLGDAAKLAQAGQTSSATLQQYYSDSGQQLPTVLEIEVLRSALDPDINPPSPAMIKSIEGVQTSLRYRALLAKELSETYSSFYELSSTGYSEDFKASATELYGAIGGFAKALNVTNPVTDAHVNLLSNLFGLAIKEKQKRLTGKANAVLLQQLEMIAKLLERDHQVVSATRQAAIRQFEQGGIALWRAGVVSAKPLLSKYGGVSGLEMVSSETLFTSENPKLRDSVPALITFRLGRIAAKEEAQYAAMEGMVQELQRRHREIAAGAPVNLASLRELVSTLQTFRNDYEALTKGSAGNVE